MKKLRYLIVSLSLIIFVSFTAGCYAVNAQPMKNIKGTYKLTHYTSTSKAKNSEGVLTTTTTDRLTTNEMEVYLVLTGSSISYCYYKTADGAYAYELSTTYEANEEDSSKYDFVSFGTYPFLNSDISRLGITKSGLNFSRPPMYWEPFGQPQSTLGYDVNLQKVDKATDLSYVEKVVTEDFNKYTLANYKLWGGYEVRYSLDQVLTQAPEGEAQATVENFRNPYKYHYITIDPATKKATSYSMLHESTEQKQVYYDVVLTSDDWTTIQIGEDVWTQSNNWSTVYERTFTMDYDGLELQIKAEMQLVYQKDSEDYILEQIETYKEIEETENFASYDSGHRDYNLGGTYKLMTNETSEYEITTDGETGATKKTTDLLTEAYLVISNPKSNYGYYVYKEGDKVYRYKVDLDYIDNYSTPNDKDDYSAIRFKKDGADAYENIFSLKGNNLEFLRPAIHFNGNTLSGAKQVWTKVDSISSLNYVQGLFDEIIDLDAVQTPDEGTDNTQTPETGDNETTPVPAP